MSTQSEQSLENNLITQLQQLGWDRVTITDEGALITNLKKQLEVHNQTLLSVNFPKRETQSCQRVKDKLNSNNEKEE